MSQLPDSPGVEHFPQDLNDEYHRLLAQQRAEIAPIDGIKTLHTILLERWTFIYIALRSMERTPIEALDLQRYNQLTGLWVKVSSELIYSYMKIYENGAALDLLIDKISQILSEEIQDSALLGRIRTRIATAANE